MEKKNNLFIIGGVVLLIVVVAILVATMSKPQNVTKDVDLNSMNPITNDVVSPESDSLVDANQSAEALETADVNSDTSLEQEGVVARDYTEADLVGLELMTESEKQVLNIDTDFPVQVLERDVNGAPVYFRYIEKKADIQVIQ